MPEIERSQFVAKFVMGIHPITSSLRESAAAVRKWKEFRRQTGHWPLLSIAASLFQIIVFVVRGGFLIW